MTDKAVNVSGARANTSDTKPDVFSVKHNRYHTLTRIIKIFFYFSIISWILDNGVDSFKHRRLIW